MPSIQAKIAEFFFKLQPYDWTKGTISEQRAKQERSTRFFKIPGGVHFQVFDLQGIPATWIKAENPGQTVILYLHGGAYALGSINVYREFLARLAVAAQCQVLAIDYRLAPDHPFPAALEDALTAYRWLAAQGFDLSRIVIAGDSAGGGLTLAALLALRDGGEKLPACAVCISPWVDLGCSGGAEHIKNDPLLSPRILEGYAHLYAGDLDKTSPFISPLYADLRSLPPILIHVGTHEILLDEACLLAENARRAGVNVTLETWEKMFHVFQIIPFIPESKTSLQHIAEFIAEKSDQSNFSPF